MMVFIPTRALAAGVLMIGLSACVQMPTETRSVVDQRPQISFRFDAANEQHAQARVMVDGVDVGRARDFVDGRATLRILPGTHSVKVIAGGRVLLEERAYLADGVVRPFMFN